MLKLDKNINTYPLIARTNAEHFVNAIYISTRSLLGIMFCLSHSVSTSNTDEISGIVTTTRDKIGNYFDWNKLTDGLFSIKSASDTPELASINTYYRDSWFYIDDRDLDSKSTFSLLVQLFSLQSGKTEGLAPILTLPVGQ